MAFTSIFQYIRGEPHIDFHTQCVIMLLAVGVGSKTLDTCSNSLALKLWTRAPIAVSWCPAIVQMYR